MANWPNIAEPFEIDEDLYYPQIVTEFEANYVQSRLRGTRETRRWSLTWNAMTSADYVSLQTFFVTNQSISFTWTNPVTSVSYDCRFLDDSLKGRIVPTGIINLTVNIGEV